MEIQKCRAEVSFLPNVAGLSRRGRLTIHAQLGGDPAVDPRLGIINPVERGHTLGSTWSSWKHWRKKTLNLPQLVYNRLMDGIITAYSFLTICNVIFLKILSLSFLPVRLFLLHRVNIIIPFAAIWYSMNSMSHTWSFFFWRTTWENSLTIPVMLSKQTRAVNEDHVRDRHCLLSLHTRPLTSFYYSPLHTYIAFM